MPFIIRLFKITKHILKAIIYDKKGRILSIGENSYIKTHPLQARIAKSINDISLHHKIYLHAEISAIIKCNDLSKAHRIFVSRVDQRGQFRLAKPCPVCMKAINEMTNIKVVEFTQ